MHQLEAGRQLETAMTALSCDGKAVVHDGKAAVNDGKDVMDDGKQPEDRAASDLAGNMRYEEAFVVCSVYLCFVLHDATLVCVLAMALCLCLSVCVCHTSEFCQNS